MDNMQTVFDAQEEEKKVVEIKPRRPWLTWEVGENEYHLKLTTSVIRKLEQQFKSSLLDAVLDDGVPPLNTVVALLQGALQKYHHGMTSEKVEAIIDAYLDGGGTQISLLQTVVYPLMHDAGFFTDAMMQTIISTMDNIDTQL